MARQHPLPSTSSTHPPPTRLSTFSSPLTEAEVLEFYSDLDPEKRGFVTLTDLTARLEAVIDELSPLSKPAQRGASEILPRGLEDLEAGPRGFGVDRAWLREFVQRLLPDFVGSGRISREEFVAVVSSWNVPSPSPSQPTTPERPAPLTHRTRAQWEVYGPRLAFLCAIVALQVAFATWQMVKYIEWPLVRAAFGWCVILSKTAAGAIYPTFFFLFLSMSRYFATLIRRFRYVPRIVNWDRSQSTHVWMAVAGLVLATVHGVGYLGGSFVKGSEKGSSGAIRMVFKGRATPMEYVDFVRLLPSWSGIAALGLYWIIAILSLPWVRRRSYETFQLAHLLMFPMIGLLCAHGTSAILQRPMLGYWVAFPLFLVLLERSTRLAHGCRSVMARVEVLDDYTATITFDHPRGNWWNYEAGQYVFLQVPSISFFQWHPFTVSGCNGKSVQVHIRTAGNWTGRLRALAGEEPIRIGVDGPFGAPSQRFYEFDRAIVMGAGVGITPFSAIMTDMEQKLFSGIDPWAQIRHSDKVSTQDTSSSINLSDLPASLTTPTHSFAGESARPHAKRRVDFHWTVREREDLRWFSSLLDRAYDLSLALPPTSLELKIHTYITTRRKDLATHIFRYLLDSPSTSPSAPYSALTGLKMRSRLGRADFEAVLREYHEELKVRGWNGGRVGVFFCGEPAFGGVIAEACAKLTAVGRRDGTRTRYVFMMEVFG